MGVDSRRVTILREDPETVAVLFMGKVTEMPRKHWTRIMAAFQVEGPVRPGDLVWIPEIGLTVEGSAAAYVVPSTLGDLYHRKKENEPNVRAK